MDCRASLAMTEVIQPDPKNSECLQLEGQLRVLTYQELGIDNVP
jgi:hypothetical protein